MAELDVRAEARVRSLHRQGARDADLDGGPGASGATDGFEASSYSLFLLTLSVESINGTYGTKIRKLCADPAFRKQPYIFLTYNITLFRAFTAVSQDSSFFCRTEVSP